MNKVFIFGDCHTNRAWEHHDPDLLDIDLRMWGRGGIKVYGLDFAELAEENAESTGYDAPIKPRTHELMESGFKYKVDFNEWENSDLVMFWLGYVDVRLLLPKYKNPDEIAKTYVDRVIDFFGSKPIRFIEPLPQFTEMLLKYEGISPSYEYVDRLEQNKGFIESLRKYSKEAGLMPPISQEQIFEAVGTQELVPSMTHTKAPHPVDGLKDEYMEKIYQLFVDESKKALDFYNIK